MNFITSYYTYSVCFVGIMGNIIAIIVFIKSKLRFQSTSQYLCALALVDNIYLLTSSFGWVLYNAGHRYYYAFYLYVTFVCITLSSWLVVSFTVERYIAVLHPLRMKTLCTVTRARYIVFFLSISAMVINIPFLLVYISPLFSNFRLVRLFISTVSLTPPIVGIVVLNSCIVVSLYRSDTMRGRRHQSRELTQRRVAVVLLIVSTLYVLQATPVFISETMANLVMGFHLDVYSKFYENVQDNYFYLDKLRYLNFAINFFVYCLGSSFREAFVETFTMTRTPLRNETHQLKTLRAGEV